MKRKNRGFTLIELLVVIAIIGTLASVVLASLNSARELARDAQRKSDLDALRKALELHYLDNGSYTQPENIWCDTSYGESPTGQGCNAVNNIGDWGPNSDLRDLVAGGYIPSLPVDPINDATYHYYYEPSNVNEANGLGSGYWIRARLESDGSIYEVRSNW